MTDSTHDIVDDALDQLVHQFARPMDFIRELIQNSIDAGSPRIEVWVDWQPPQDADTAGVLEIHVDDFGEGMDEAIIDGQLTRMFSSTKEMDRTKIGKFGIGFTSVFSIRPSYVLLHTGRHGESWEILFHPDRSFEKVRLDRAVRGTQITLFKPMVHSQANSTIDELKEVLIYWCEHSGVPITFADRRDTSQPDQASDSDGWGGFGEDPQGAQSAQTITRPMTLDSPVQVRVEQDGVEAVVGFQDPPTYSFFNGGITLIRAEDPAVLGPYAGALRHLSFKVRYAHLEHTLTRDNVMRDAAWRKAIEVIEQAAQTLPSQLIAHVQEVAASGGEDLSVWQHHLAHVLALGDSRVISAVEQASLLCDHAGTPLPTTEVLAQARKWDAFLTTTWSEDTDALLVSHGVVPLATSLGARELMNTMGATRFGLLDFLQDSIRWQPAGMAIVLPLPVPISEHTPIEQALLSGATHIIGQAEESRRVTLHLCQMGASESTTSKPLTTIGEPDQAVQKVRYSPTTLERHRFKQLPILIDRDHPMWHDLCTLAHVRPAAARLLLCQALSEACDIPMDVIDQAGFNINATQVLT